MQFEQRAWAEALERHLRLVQPHAVLDDILGDAVAPSLTARALAMSAAGHGRVAELFNIHSELVDAERLFLLGWFANRWDGQGDVIEVGPFLGSSTRAMAIGMMCNPLRRPEARITTYDRFEGYYKGDAYNCLRGLVPEDMIGRLSSTGQFYEAFEWLHRGQDYWSLIDARTASLTDSPETPLPESQQLTIDDGDPLSVLFVDGAKSWYGTKDLFLRAAPRLAPGTTVIFQDFGHYTCYWLPSFVSVMNRWFRLVAHVADTYAFEVVEPIDATDIAARFPDRPQDWPREVVDLVFTERLEAAVHHSDTYGLLSARIQHAAALADRGDTDEAVARIDALLHDPAWSERRAKIVQARRSPTYRPDGEVLLPLPVGV